MLPSTNAASAANETVIATAVVRRRITELDFTDP
jgi:hypothetical protein